MKEETLNAPHLAELDPAVINFSDTNEMFRDPSDFSPEALGELANSILENGLAQPILVRPNGQKGKYILVAGERRLRAWQLAKIPKGIPAYIRELNDEQALELQIIENLQRENINPIKEAVSFHALVKERKLSTAGIAAKIGKSIDYVQERMRLAGLIKPLQDLVRNGDIPLKAGLKFAMIPEKDQEDAMGATTEEIDLGEKGKSKVIFKGLEDLQEWMDSHLFIDLKTADFDREDATLNPAQGPCSTCKFRTKNTGGLFDDITLVDECTLASCFRTKQVANYTRLKETLKKKYPNEKIIFKKRSNSIEGMEIYRKHLVGDIKGAGAGTACSEKEAMKTKGSELAILIGVPRVGRAWSDFKHSDKFTWIKPRGPIHESTPATKEKSISPEQAAKNEQKAKDDLRKEKTIEVQSELRTFEALTKGLTEEKLLDFLIDDFIDGLYDDDFSIPTLLNHLGLKWTRKGVTNQDPVELKLAEDFDMLDHAEILPALEKATLAQKRSFLICAMWISQSWSVEKHIKIDKSKIKQAANSAGAQIFKKYLEDRDAAAKKHQAGRLDIYKKMADGLSPAAAAKEMAELEDLSSAAGKGGLKQLLKPKREGKMKYKGHKINLEKITGWIATIEDENGEVIDHEESIGLSDTKQDAAEVAKEFIDALTEEGGKKK